MLTGKKISIYLAEDDGDDAALFREAITDIIEQADITVVDNGVKLIDHLQIDSVKPDFIFLDLNMPKKNGFDCLEEIKNHDSWKKIKTIVLSTTSDEQQIKKCYSLGADLFITKVWDLKLYKDLLKECLG